MFKKIVKAEKTTRKIRIPKVFTDANGHEMTMEYNDKEIILKPVKEVVKHK